MAIKRLDRLPKRKVTVDELIEADDITDLLKGLYEKRHEIDQFALIYTDREGGTHPYYQGNPERLVFALEQAKFKIMMQEEDE